MPLEDGDLIATANEPHAQIRQQKTTDNYDWAVYVKYPHTPPKHILQNNTQAFHDRLSADDALKHFREGWVYHSGHPSEDQAREKIQDLTEEEAARHYETQIADILINKGFQLRE